MARPISASVAGVLIAAGALLPYQLVSSPCAFGGAANRLQGLSERIDRLRKEYDATAWPADTPEAVGKLLKHDMLAGASPPPEMRFAVAELSEGQAQALVEGTLKSPAARPVVAAARSAGAPSAAPVGRAIAAERSSRPRRELLTAVHADAAQIEQALGKELSKPAEAKPQAVSAARSHVWLQVKDPRGGEWRSFDPAGNIALPASGITFQQQLPEDWRHAVDVKVEVERLEGGRLARETLLQRQWSAADLEGRPVELLIIPAELSVPRMIDPRAENAAGLVEQAKAFKRFGATMSVAGEKVVEGGGFGLDGRKIAAAASAGPTGIGGGFDPFKRLPGGAGGRAGAAASPELAGV